MRELTIALARRIAGRLRSDERGAVAIIVAVLLGAGVLTGIGAMAVDVGELYQERAELQNGADAGALAVAKSCALGNCTSNIAGYYADANASTLTGNLEGVSRVCGSVHGLGGCPQGNGVATDCPPPTTQNYVDVFTETRTASGNLLPPVFADALLGNGSYNGTKVKACAQATWGAPTTGTTAAFTISACEWDQATQQGAQLAVAPPYPPSPLPAAAVDQVLTLSTKPGNDAGCGSEPAGADGPNTLGWLNHVPGNCTVPVSPPTMAGRTKSNVSYSCELLLQNAQQTMTPLLVPTYVSESGSSFSLQGLAYFVVTGYNLPASFNNQTFTANDWLNPSNSCTGTTYCVNGYFVSGTVGSSAGLNGTYQGVDVLQLTG